MTYWAYVGETDFSYGGAKRERRLLLDCEMELQGTIYIVRALIDTGAEVNVIRKGIIPEQDLVLLERPWRLTAANQQTILGGDKEARVVLCLAGVEVDTKKQCGLKIPTTFLVADLGKVDAILSYQWLSDAQLIINPSRHGIFLTDHKGRGMIWVAGVRTDPESTLIAPPSEDPLPLGEEDFQESGIGVLPVKFDSLGNTEEGKGGCTMASPPGGFILMRTAPHPPHSTDVNLMPSTFMGTSNLQSPPSNQPKGPPLTNISGSPGPGAPGHVKSTLNGLASEVDPHDPALHLKALGLSRGILGDAPSDPLLLPINGGSYNLWHGGNSLHSVTQGSKVDQTQSPMRLLDLYSGYGSVAEVFQARGYEVVTVDIDPTFKPTIQTDMLLWEYWLDFPPGHFDVVACSPPCTEFSQAMTRRARELDYADSLVLKGLEIIEYFPPRVWFLENPKTGLLPKRPYMKGLAYVDVDYCCFSDWGYRKPTRIWGSRSLGFLPNVICDPKVCPSVELREDGVRGHRERLGRTPLPGLRKLDGKSIYRIPPNVIRYVMGWPLEKKAESPTPPPLEQAKEEGVLPLERGEPGLVRPATEPAGPALAQGASEGPEPGAVTTHGPAPAALPHELAAAKERGGFPCASLPGITALAPPQKKRQKNSKKK